jgi:hypothetical protein
MNPDLGSPAALEEAISLRERPSAALTAAAAPRDRRRDGSARSVPW